MKNFNEILQTLISVNDKLINGEIDIEKAKVIGQNTQILINAAKVQLEYCKQTKEIPLFLTSKKPIFDELKEIANEAVKLNDTDNFDSVVDKRPFGF